MLYFQAALLLRFYEPQSGAIYMDGVDIKEMNLKWLRKHIAAVSQEPVLFSGTIRENIMYGLKSDEDENIASKLFDQVVQQSYVDDFVKTLPDGYETLVGQRGLTLSGGQRQRVAIARALIRVSSYNCKGFALDNQLMTPLNISHFRIRRYLFWMRQHQLWTVSRRQPFKIHSKQFHRIELC